MYGAKSEMVCNGSLGVGRRIYYSLKRKGFRVKHIP